jgi:hypothetical protein
MDAWGNYPGDEGSFVMRRFLEHGVPPQVAAYRAHRRRISHSEAGSRRSYSQSIISDMYTDEMDTVEEVDEDEDGMDGDSSMNDFIDDDEAPAGGSRSVSSASTSSQTPQPSNTRPRAQGRARRVVESEASSTVSSVIEEEDEDEEDQGPIRRGQRNRAQTRILNRANGARRPITVPGSTSTDASGEQELDEETQALLREEGWVLQHVGPDEEMEEDEMSDGGQTTVGWDATAISNDRLRMGGSLTPTADRLRPSAPIRPPSRVGNPRFLDASRGLRRRSSVLSTSTAHLEDGEADDDNSDYDQDGDIAMAMNSLRSRRSRVHLRNFTPLNNNNLLNGRFMNPGLSQNNPIDLDTDDNSDASQPGQPGRRRTAPQTRPPEYNPRISWMFADHQRALQEFQRPGTLIDLEPRSTTPLARPRTANRNRPSPAPQYSPFGAPAPARLRTPLMDNSSNLANGRIPPSPGRRTALSPTSQTTSGASTGIATERATSVGSMSNASTAVPTPGSSTPTSQHSVSALSQAQAAAAADMIDRPPSRVGARPPSASGRRNAPGFSPVYPTFPHNNVGLNIQRGILQSRPMGNPWGAFVQPHGIRPRTSRPALRDQSSTATLRAVNSRINIREVVSQPQGMRTQASRVDLRHQPSRRRLNNQSSTRTLRASEHARPPQPTAAAPASPNQSASRTTRLTADERDVLARELVNNRMRALGGTQQPGAHPVRTNPFAPGFRRANAMDMPAASTTPTGPHHVRNNSNESINSGNSSATAHNPPSSPGLARRRSSRNIAAAPPVLSQTQGSFSPPSTAYANTYFRGRQGSFTGSSPAYESSLNSSARSPMVAVTGQLI